MTGALEERGVWLTGPLTNNTTAMPSAGVGSSRISAVSPVLHTYQSGATRSSDESKPDFEGFLSPLVIEEYGRYMHACRLQDDGALRDSDNWQRGMDRSRYVKSAWRHFLAWWTAHRAGRGEAAMAELMALMFNVMGYAHEVLESGNACRANYEAWRKGQVEVQ